MLIYSKKVEDEIRLFGTLKNIPSEDDAQLIYTDAENVELENRPTLDDTYLDNGKGGIIQKSTGEEIKVFIDTTNVIPGDSSEPVPPAPVSGPYITFSSAEPFSISTKYKHKSWNGTIEYSTDTENWTEWNGTEVNSSEDRKLYFRGSNNTIISLYDPEDDIYNPWVLNGDGISCIGNIENLLDYQTVMNGEHPQMSDSCYRDMFKNCTSLTIAPELPATTLARVCYSNMFWGCTSLTTAPELPATTLTEYCYNSMFYNCTSLTTAPELPATTLADSCYTTMFSGCSALTDIPELSATALTYNCYYGMFQLCTSIKLSETQDADYITPYRIPTTGTGTEYTNALASMFGDTGGTFTGTPTINTIYYLHKDNHIV